MEAEAFGLSLPDDPRLMMPSQLGVFVTIVGATVLRVGKQRLKQVIISQLFSDTLNRHLLIPHLTLSSGRQIRAIHRPHSINQISEPTTTKKLH